MLANLPLDWLLLTLFTGLCVGSFLNVVIYRLPIIMERQWRAHAGELLTPDAAPTEPGERFNLAVPASRCPACAAPIKPWHNIPVLSYLWLRGKCRHCSAKISVRYPLVEAGTAVLSLLVLAVFGPTEQALVALLFTWMLIALALIDYDTQFLLDNITYPLLWLGLAVNSLGAFTDLQSAVWGALLGYLSLWSVFWVFKLVTGKDGMGYGDFKLLAALGAWMGWQALPLIILLSAGCGAIIGGAQILLGQRERGHPMPFGPFLAAAGWIALLWREPIIAAYFRAVGLQ